MEDNLNCWKDKILFPKLSVNATQQEKLEFEKIAEISKYFGGQPQTGAKATQRNVELPKLKAPVKIKLKKTRHKRKREGC